MSIRDINLLLSDVSEVSELIPLLIGYFLMVRKPPYRIIVWLFTISAPIKMASLITAKLSMHNMFLFYFLAVFEVVFLYSFFNKILFNKIKVWGIAALILINLVSSVYIGDLSKFNTIAWSLNTFVLLCMGLAVFHRLFVSLEVIHLEKDATFVITSGWMIYFAGALFTYIFSSRILSGQTGDFFHNAWIIQSFSNILKNLIVSYGLWLVRYP